MKTTRLLIKALDCCALRPLLCISMAAPQGALATLLTAGTLVARADAAENVRTASRSPGFTSAPASRPADRISNPREIQESIGRPVERLRGKREPTDLDIFGARVFDEPLIPIGGKSDPAQNHAVANALLAYAERTDLDDFSSLTQFLQAFPGSAWRPSLLLHLGTEYYNHGLYSKALEAWEEGWKVAEGVRSGKGKGQADRLVGELARMYSKVGRMAELSRLLQSIESRDLEGPATQLIHAAKAALEMMENKPDFCFKCGPLALERIQRRHNPSKTHHAAVIDARSGTNGFSLVEVAKLSRVTEMNYQMAFRSPGAEFLVPAVVHWNVGHFAALVEREEETGRFLAQDDTFGNSVYITPAALEAEGTGYFLVPPGPLPIGWRKVSEEEGWRVWGKGNVDGAWPGATSRYDTRCRPCDPSRPGGGAKSKHNSPPGPVAAAEDPSSALGSLASPGTLTAPEPPDFSQPPPAAGARGPMLGRGPGGLLPANPAGDVMFNARGMAAYDFHALLASLIVDDTPVGYSPPVGPSVEFTASYHQYEANQPATFSYSNLGAKWTCNWVSYITDSPSSPNADVRLYVDGGGTLDFSGFNPATQSYRVEVMSQAKLVKLSSSTYEMQFADGSKRQFLRSDGSAGSTRRVFLSKVIDRAGNAVELRYDAQLRITNILDAIGQVTMFQHTNTAFPFAITSVTDPFGRSAHFHYNAAGMLVQITDVIGITSQFAYGTSQLLNALTTPYGTTTFSAGGMGRASWFLQATDPLGQSERVEFQGFSANNGYPDFLPNSEVPRGLATFNRFIDGRNSFYWDKKAYAEGAGDYTKARSYHWVHYVANSAAPILEIVKHPLMGRIWFNYPGQPTNFGAPYYLNSAYAGAMNKPSIVARVLDDGSTQLSTYEYNALGRVTKTVDPVGRTFTYVYDSNNVDLLEIRMTRAGKNELLQRATYNSQHLPITISDASGQTTTNTYNARGQLASRRNPLGEVTTYTYDTNGYLRSINGPLVGATNDLTLSYDGAGRVQTMTVPQGYAITYAYDALDRVTRLTYPDGSFQQYAYDKLDMAAFRDRLGNWTTNSFDSVRRLIQTRDSLGRIWRYSWCHCGAPESSTDPMDRTTQWNYDVRGRLMSKVYSDGSQVSFEYENSRGLLTKKIDETGQVTVYDYHPDESLKQVRYLNTAVPTPGVSLTYDPDYYRVLSRHGGEGITRYTYYPIHSAPVIGAGAVQAISGPLPNSTVTYQYDAAGRVISRSINGVTETRIYDALGRPRVVNNALGTFHYGFVDVTAALAVESYPNGQTNLYTYYGNAGDRRLQQVTYLKPDGSLLSLASYAYNGSAQITSWTNQYDNLPTRIWNYRYDNAGQLATASRMEGGAEVAAYAYNYDATGNRISAASNSGTNEFEFNSLNQLVAGEAPLNAEASYEWDGANRLVAINQGTRRSEFSYDGLGRRVRILEKTNGVVITDSRFVWAGAHLCEMRDATGSNVTRRFFAQGESLVGSTGVTNLFYTRSHLNTIREATDSTGVVRARFDYDPWGGQIPLVSEIAPAFGFTGHFQHRPSGLHLSLYRPFDPNSGRWLSRDPIEEAGGLNLYQYGLNDPVNLHDPTGEAHPCLIAAAVGAGVGAVAGLATAIGGFALWWFDKIEEPPVKTGLGVFGAMAGGAAAGAVIGGAGCLIFGAGGPLAPMIAPVAPFAGPFIAKLAGRVTNSDCLRGLW